MKTKPRGKVRFQKAAVIFLGIFVFLCLVPLVAWEIRQFGKKLPHDLTIMKNGQPLPNAVVSVTVRRRNWTDLYEISTEKSRLLEESRPHSMYLETDSSGKVHLSKRGVYFQIDVYHDLKKFSKYWDNLTVFSFLDDSWDISKADYVAPVIQTMAEYETYLNQAEGVFSTSGLSDELADNTVVCYGGDPGVEHWHAFMKKTRETSEVLYIKVLTGHLERELLDSIPYEVSFHDTADVFLRYTTRVSDFDKNRFGYICILVPKDHSYDISFHPDKSDWPGMSINGVLPKPLEPLTIRAIKPRSLPLEPFRTVSLKSSRSYRLMGKGNANDSED